MYQSQHKRTNLHQKPSNLDTQIKKKAAFGLTLAGTTLVAATPALTTVTVNAATTNNSTVQTTKSAAAKAATSTEKAAAPAVKTAQQVEAEALVVIHGDLGNGNARVQALQAAGYDPTAVQNQVNQDYVTMGLGGAEEAANQAAAAPAAATPAQSAGTISSFNNSVNTGSDVVDSAAQAMANNTGVPASQWAAVIMRESGGNPNAVNASSGAYGLFQLLGHGEYQGMSVDAQVSMATAVYQSQGAGAWSETW